MFRNLTSVLLMTIACLAMGCSKPEMNAFSPTGGGFKVLMPGTPKEQTVPTAGVQMKVYSAEATDGAYIVSYTELPMRGKESAAQIQSLLDRSRDGQLSKVGGKLVSESKIQLNGKFPGRDIRADVPSKQAYVRSQIFIVDKRLYQVFALGRQPWVNSPESNEFFDSFAVIEK